MSALDRYEEFVGRGTLDELRLLAERLAGRRIVTVNSTAVGGGVAEILNRLVPLCHELGVDMRWEVIKGGEDFFAFTKRLHNALQGQSERFTAHDYDVYLETMERNRAALDLGADVVFVHDPQPAGLVEARNAGPGHWVWRCHIDLSAPEPESWDFVSAYLSRYDAAVFSAPQFAANLAMPQAMVTPSIDPLSDKNRDLSEGEIDDILARLRVPRDVPIVTQVSRFDRFKDPRGVLEAFRLVRKHKRCRLVLAGGGAADDPEAHAVLAAVHEQADGDPDVHVLELPPTANLEINALQRASTVIVQKSLREGFGLTVSEALWKGKPVIATAVGGIPLQVTHRYSGILTHTIEGVAFWIKQLLNTPEFARRLGENGREHVRTNFLLTRHLRDYLLLFLFLDHPGERVIRLD